MEKFRHKKPYIKKITIELIYDQNPDLSYLKQNYKYVEDEEERRKYIKEDYERLKAYYNNEWYMMGIVASATILQDYPHYKYTQILGEIRSGGIWGNESDSDEKFLQTTKKGQIRELKEILKNLNIKIPRKIEIEEKEEFD